MKLYTRESKNFLFRIDLHFEYYSVYFDWIILLANFRYSITEILLFQSKSKQYFVSMKYIIFYVFEDFDSRSCCYGAINSIRFFLVSIFKSGLLTGSAIVCMTNTSLIFWSAIQSHACWIWVYSCRII